VSEYDGKQFVGIDLHRRHSVIVRQTSTGEPLSVRILNDPDSLALQLGEAGEHPDVVLEATYGWYWAVDALQAAGATVHLAHPLGVKGFRYRRVKNDVRDASDLADLLRMNRLPEAWIAHSDSAAARTGALPRKARRAALEPQSPGACRARKAGVLIAVSDLFGIEGRRRLARVPLGAAARSG
jgi:transposase